MQNDLNYERAWDKISKQFWRRRWRELAIHTALFIVANLYVFINPQSVLTFTTGYAPLMFLRDFGFENFPWMTLNWGFILALHMLLLIGVALGERIFRYGVERELLRDFAQANRMDEKRKMRPSYNHLGDDEPGFEAMDEADEAAYRQSTR